MFKSQFSNLMVGGVKMSNVKMLVCVICPLKEHLEEKLIEKWIKVIKSQMQEDILKVPSSYTRYDPKGF